MVVQSNNDASQQQLYRQEDHTGEIIFGAAAVGGLAYLLSKGHKGIKGDVPKINEAVGGPVATANQPTQLEKAVEAANQLKAPDLKGAEYQNGQQYVVDNILGQLGKETSVPLEDAVNSIKQKSNLKNSIDTNTATPKAEVKSETTLQTQELQSIVESNTIPESKKPISREDIKTVNINDVINAPK